LATGVRKLLREHQSIFTSKGEDEEIVMSDVIRKVQHRDEPLLPTNRYVMQHVITDDSLDIETWCYMDCISRGRK
jgi:hypothetical protein